MNRNPEIHQAQIPRRRFLRLLGAMGLGLLALPVTRIRRAPAPLSLWEADYYRSRDRGLAG